MEAAVAARPPSRMRVPRVLIVSPSQADVRLLLEQFEDEAIEARSAPDAAAVITAFERDPPDVIVLGFEELRQADECLLSLYRHSDAANRHAHRTVLLCRQDDVGTAYALCRKRCYDDYVLYWPLAQDGLRLRMSVWNAAREVLDAAARPPTRNLRSHVGRVEGMQNFLEQQVEEGDRFSTTVRGALQEVQGAVNAAIDAFRARATSPTEGLQLPAPAERTFGRDIEQLKREGVGAAFRQGAAALGDVARWPADATRRFRAMAAEARALAGALAAVEARAVMVVEDDAVQRELIVAALSDPALSVSTVSDGAALIGALRRTRPELVVMDVNLPDIDGIALTRMMKGLPRLAAIPVLMLTGDASKDTLARSVEAGAAGYVVKPFKAATLRAHVARLLPRR